MNWSDPNFVSLFAAWGQWAAAFGSFLAVIAAIWIALRSSKVTLKNVGTGTAFNIVSVLFGPESLNESGKRVDASQNDYWQNIKNILSVGINTRVSTGYLERPTPV